MSTELHKKRKSFAQRFAQRDFVFGEGPSNLSDRDVRKQNYYQDLDERQKSRQG